MKPVSLNQLLFHRKSPSLSFFQSPYKNMNGTAEFDLFMSDMMTQLELQGKNSLKELLKDTSKTIQRLIKNHPDKSHGFFLADDLVGYVILDQEVDAFCTISQNFHVRPLLEELLVNTEYMVVNVSLYDIKVYRGDFQYLEIVGQYEFDQLPKAFFGENNSRLFAPQYLGLIPFKTILALKTIAQKIMDMILYQSMPVIVTGLEEIKNIFLRYFEHAFGVITHLNEDFYEKTCVEILNRCKDFRYTVIDFYSAQLKERLKRLVKAKRLISTLEEIKEAVHSGRVVHLILPLEKKHEHKKSLGCELNELAEEVMKQGGRIQFLGPHFFPESSHVLAILKG